MNCISSNQQIVLNRGDTLQLPIFINQGTDFFQLQYILGENDKLYIGIMEANELFENALIKKVYTSTSDSIDNNILFKLDSSETANLLPGTYYYEIKLQFYINDTEYINTIVPKTKFIIV